MMPKFLSAPASVTEVLVNIQPRDQGGDCTPAARVPQPQPPPKATKISKKRALTDFIKFWNSS